MSRKVNSLDMAGKKRLSDEELSKKLGHYQKISSVLPLVGVIGAVSGIVAFFVVRDAALKAILTAVLFFGGVFCAVYSDGGVKKKLNALMQEHLGGFFRAEFERAFGPDLRTPELCIDGQLMEALHLSDGQWEECVTENLHEGVYRGARFSAANVRLDHVYTKGAPHEGFETCRRAVFKGLAVRCETCAASPSPIRINAQAEDGPHDSAAVSGEFDRRFRVTAEREADARSFLTPQCMDLLTKLDRSAAGRLSALCREGNVLSLVFETDFVFAAVADGTDLRNLDEVKKSYIDSLHAMEALLDLLRESPALTGAAE